MNFAYFLIFASEDISLYRSPALFYFANGL